MYQSLLAIVLMAGLSGCHHFTHAQTNSVPALVQASAANTQQLEQALARLLNASQIKIDASAFTQSSQLTIARAPHYDDNALLVMGRRYEPPHNVRLYLENNQCIIKLVGSEKRQVVTQVTCRAE